MTTQLRRIVPLPARVAMGTAVDPIMLEVFNNLFMSIAEQMGAVLENTSQSVNVKERLDFSCALFDRAGDLVANAPHMPVHLGSMSENSAIATKKRSAFRRLVGSGVYMSSALGLSCLFFVVTGIQFWVTKYLMVVIGIAQGEITLAFGVTSM